MQLCKGSGHASEWIPDISVVMQIPASREQYDPVCGHHGNQAAQVRTARPGVPCMSPQCIVPSLPEA